MATGQEIVLTFQLNLADSGDSLEIFNGNIRVRVFRGPTRRKRSLLGQSSYEINGENARSYHDDEHSIDYNRNADRRNKYPYFHERRKRQQVDRVVIQGIDQVVRAVFQTDSSGTARGVSSTFEQITECGARLGRIGTFKSPDFPGNYPNNARCVWTAAFLLPQQRIVFTLNSLDLADPGDTLEFFNGDKSEARFQGMTRRKRSLGQKSHEHLIGEDARSYYKNQNDSIDHYNYDHRRYSVERRKRQQPNRVIFSGTSQDASVVFESDTSGSARGFSITFQIITTCGGQLINRVGGFRSPGFPGNYPNNARCVWTTFLRTRQRIVFDLRSVTLGDPGDSLRFFNGGATVAFIAGSSRRKRSLYNETSRKDVFGEDEDSYYDHEDNNDHYYYDGRRKKEAYIYERRKRRARNRVVIRGRNRMARVIFQTDASGTASGFRIAFRKITETDSSESERTSGSSGESSDED